MPIDYVALRNEILNGPKSATLTPMFNAGDDTGVAAILNIRDERGSVPISEISAIALEIGLYGHCEVQIRKPVVEGNSPTGNEDIHRLAHDTLTLLRDDYRLNVADVDSVRFQAGLGAYVALGWMTEAQANQITALGANRSSRAELVVGQLISETDIVRAREAI